MTDIRTEVELRHPVRRVWRALTDQQLLEKWLGTTDLRPEEGVEFQLRPLDLLGLDGELSGAVVKVDEPHRLVLRWREGDVPVLVSYELTSTDEGSRLILHQSGTDGHWTPEQQEQRQQAYAHLVSGPLPAVLDWLAFREIDFTTEPPASGSPVADTPTGEIATMTGAPASDGHAGPGRGRRRLTAGLIALTIVTGTVMVVVAVTRPVSEANTSAPPGAPTDSTPGSTTSMGAVPSATGAVPSRAGVPRATATATATATAIPSGSPPTPPPATAVPPVADEAAPSSQPNLDAQFRGSPQLLGYTGEIVLANSGTAEAAQWSVTVVLHGGASVGSASGASYQQKGRTVTFTGAPVPAGGSARFTFQVNAALSERQPASCTVDDRACTGL